MIAKLDVEVDYHYQSQFFYEDNKPKYGVVHSTRSGRPDNALEYQRTNNWFKDPAASVSTHYVVHADGTLAQAVRIDQGAWHAGDRSFNQTSIGVEMAQNYVTTPYTLAGYRTLANIWVAAEKELGIPARHLSKSEFVIGLAGWLGHDEFDEWKRDAGYTTWPRGKSDPGVLFDWALVVRLAESETADSTEPAPPPDILTDQRGQEVTAAYRTLASAYSALADVIEQME